MAQVDCFSKSDIEVLETGMEACDGPPMKKFKQVRLPFKPLDPTSQKQVIGSSPGGKKRKLSDNESPSAKQMRTSKQVQKPITVECDPEVSSSSETDVNTHGHKKGARKINTLDSFFKPKTIKQDEQEEITSTNDYIDLTDNKSDDDNAEGKSQETESMEISVEVESKICEENKDVITHESSKEVENSEVESATDSVDKEEDKENEDKRKSGLDQSFISDISVCEDAIKTPAKTKNKDAQSESTEKDTVTSVESTIKSSTSDAAPVEVTKQIKTPGSAPRKLSERKLKEKEEQRLKREKELEEKRLQKQKEKEEKERIRLEKKKQKDDEKLEKEKARLEEKEKKEQERLEKLKQKEEEKRMKDKELEAKMEEKKKKDEEKKQKDEEKKQKEEERKQKEEEKKKEEEEKLKKEEKKKESFKNFFFKKAPTVSPPKSSENTMKSFFMPFEVKPNMRLAPEYRACLDDEQKKKLDDFLCEQTVEENYIKYMRDSSFIKRQSTKTWPRDLNEEKDVEIISHDKDVIEKVTHHAKFLGFHENTRPAYYGTWRKKSSKLTPRNPFKQDEALFDYEVDSDDEWVEEEPGESVSSDEEEDEDKEKEDDDEEEEAGWMVPHGYLSDGEGAEDEEEVDNASKQDLQKIRQAAWESELKRQAKPLRMIDIGCYWSGDSTSKIAAQQLEMLLKYKAVSLIDDGIPTSHSIVKTEVSSSKKKDKNVDKAIKSSQRKSVPEEAIPDLIQLLHGNPSGMKNLIKEFRMFWKLKTDPSASSSANDTAETSQLETSAMDVDDKQEKVEQETPKPSDSKAESQDDFSISKRQLWMKIPVIAVREKRPEHKKNCWYVHTDILKQYNMEDITLPNTWKYVCVKEPKWALEKEKPEENANTSTGKAGPTASTPSGRSTPNIMQYAQPMSLSQIQALGMPAVIKASTPELKVKVQVELIDSTPVTPVQHSLPPDQKTIKDMFSGKKVKRELLSPASSKLPELKKEVHTQGSPKNALTTFLKANTSQEMEVIEIKDDEIEKCKNISEADKKLIGVNKPITPKTSGHQVLESILSSPELMKASPDNKKPGNKEGKGVSKDAGTEQRMEVDVIVID